MKSELFTNVYVFTGGQLAGAAALFTLVAYGIGYAMGAICTPRERRRRR